MRITFKYLICGLFLAVASYNSLWLLPRATAQTQIDFSREIEPIFAQACYQCHSAKRAMGQLRLDVKKLAMKGGISGVVIVPGNSAQSLLMKRILGEGGKAQMPMGTDPLKQEQIELIRKWIDQGAVRPDDGSDSASNPQNSAPSRHWAYVKLVRPAIPEVKNRSWVRNPIDAFILARLEKEGMAPSPEADRAVLLRRVYLDLIGLPPSVKEVDEFLADRSSDAYEKIVDRLLSSPHYGERWARPWLDLARYADSNGYEKDNLRVMWRYRDWVINALNKDMPFDQFTIEQIAGDMLPAATNDQKIATGFHRNTMLNQEGGIDPEEARWETLIDRVNTTATVWLGSTLGCAQCHNHKYDPFTQTDYYRMLAFFENAEYQIAYQTPGEVHSRFVFEPQLSLPTPEQEAKRQVIDQEMKQLEARLKTQTPELDAELAKWERRMIDEQNRWTVLDAMKFESSGGSTLRKLDDQSILVSGSHPENDVYIITAKTDLQNITGLRIEAIPDPSLPQGGPGRDLYGNFLLTGIEVVAAPINGPTKTRLTEFSDGNVDDSAYKFDAKKFFSKDQLNAAVDTPKGWFINATRDPQGPRLRRQAVFTSEKTFGFESGTLLTIKLKHQAGTLSQGIGRFRLSVTNIDEPFRIVSIPARLRPVLLNPASNRTQIEQSLLAAQFRASTPLLKTQRDRLERLKSDLKALGIPTALVMQERPSFERPSTLVRERGSFMNKGEKVYAATPAILSPVPENVQFNRLGLARWLVDENNPLVGRVTVNRFWEQIFGRGLVETSEDFGSQGERPSHPELLDWLAVEFMQPGWLEQESGRVGDGEREGKGEETPHSALRTPHSTGWSMKWILRLIVTSAAYRQSSAVTAALLEKDLYNRLLARGPRFRMEAEMVRDVALTASGLISRKIGGPSVMPLQPEGVWRNPYSSEKWITSKGEDRYRRGLYTFIRRTSPYPALITFDATSREYCTVRRVRTNTPLQALAMLNDEASFEAARALAKRILDESSGDVKARVIYGFRLCVTRMPKEKEIDRLVALYQQQLSYFNSRSTEAEKVVRNQLTRSANANRAKFAAWTIVANVLLNLDETVTKE